MVCTQNEPGDRSLTDGLRPNCAARELIPGAPMTWVGAKPGGGSITGPSLRPALTAARAAFNGPVQADLHRYSWKWRASQNKHANTYVIEIIR